MTHDGRTVLGNVRRKDAERLEVWFPKVGEECDRFGPPNWAPRLRDDHDWETPCIECSSDREFDHLDLMFYILNTTVLPLLKRMLNQSWLTETGTCLPSEILNYILIFAVPHYEEAARHTPYVVNETAELLDNLLFEAQIFSTRMIL